jgi:predicted ArsR family transcriptional regulator
MTATDTALEPRTRHSLLERLKWQGARDAGALAEELGVSAMAVRQHLYALASEGLVTFEERSGKVGRPTKLWRLTAAADRFFPDGHAELALSLLAALREALGEAGLDRLLAARTAEQIAAYGRRVKAADPLKTRLEALARIRSEEGYMAAVEPIAPAGPEETAGGGDGGGFLLVENHCPVCAAARACQGLCASELEVFRRVLGPDVTVERTDHILAGARRCAYRVRPAG